MNTTTKGGECRISGRSVDEVNKHQYSGLAKCPHMVPCSIESPCDASSDATARRRRRKGAPP